MLGADAPAAKSVHVATTVTPKRNPPMPRAVSADYATLIRPTG